MSNMIERVAKEIYQTMSASENVGWEEAQFIHKEICKIFARAAIAAMRDCTPKMLDAGSAAHPAGGYKRTTLLNDIIECEWRAMVDAALEEK